MAHLERDLGNARGTLLITSVEDNYKRGRIHEPWVGFVHSVPQTPEEYNCFFGRKVSLTELFDLHWGRTGKLCRGLYTLCEYTKQFVQQHSNVPVNVVHHPTYFTSQVFDFDQFYKAEKKLLFVGSFLRRWSDFFNIKTTYHKCLLEGALCDYKRMYKCFNIKNARDVVNIRRLSDEDYDSVLTNNLIFLPYYDCAASNALIECIVRHTPVLVNKVGGVAEYLGENYPLYYNDLEEANRKIEDMDLVKYAHEYLKELPKEKFTMAFFLKSILKSEIYRSL